ncbi:MAG: beta-N-acetylhexosaminidase [Myxococcota bacterium]|nr:beta-N-acetylhexosaminidase [Myxococcota bacterium]
MASQKDPLAGLVLAGFEGPSAHTDEVAQLAELGVGGFVLFGRNIESPQQVHRLLADLASLCPGRNLLLAVDQEGGRVARLRAPLTEWPPMAELGAKDDETLARDVGRAMATELRALGFNVNFAPVLDVLCSETTPAIGDRSLGTDPARVGRLGAALIAGIESAGILACAKHFPGHGHVAEDSHLKLPSCPLDEEAWRRDHLAPFSEAISAGVGSLMTAHVKYPGLGVHKAATLSRSLMTGVLRNELGFAGVIFSDDLGMGAITVTDSVGSAAIEAIEAGVDGLLVCRRLNAVQEVVSLLRGRVDVDPEFERRCRQSLERLDKAAQDHPSRPSPPDQLNVLLGAESHQALAAQLAKVELSPDPTEGHSQPDPVDADADVDADVDAGDPDGNGDGGPTRQARDD